MQDQKITFVDCTLRDGEQAPGVLFTLEEKLAIADLLDAAGVDILDAGMPSVSDEERSILEALLDRGYRATIAATVRALRDEIDLALACGPKEIFLFMPVSPQHLQHKFGLTLEQAQLRIEEAIGYAVAKGLRVHFVAEDTVRADSVAVAAVFDRASEMGATTAILCDTVGVMRPEEMTRYVRDLRSHMESEIALGVHCHNDYGLATADTLAAVGAGCAIDLALGHDATIELLIERFKKIGRHIWDPARCFFAADHFVPPSTPERADILNRYLDFVKEESVPEDLLYRGISHQLLVEDRRCQPGMVICGADSHTVMAGALGCFATGMGSTDIMATLLTGDLIATVPKSILVRLTGKIPSWLFGKEIVLEIIRRIGEGGAVAHALEYHDQTEPGLSMDSRFTVSNMSVEAGATNGIFAPDEALRRYLARRDDSGEGNGRSADARFEAVWLDPDPDADYAQKLEINVEDAPPLVALPGDLNRIVPISEVEGRPIQQVFVGSCAGGRVEDLAIVARLLRNRRVAQGVMLVVTPASQTVYNDCLRNGIFRLLAEAGALITNSSCGACGGIDKGLIGAGQACLSTSNRNFRGRMGSPDGLIYLASPLAAAAAAMTGRLTDPRPPLADAGIDDFHSDPWPDELDADGERS